MASRNYPGRANLAWALAAVMVATAVLALAACGNEDQEPRAETPTATIDDGTPGATPEDDTPEEEDRGEEATQEVEEAATEEAEHAAEEATEEAEEAAEEPTEEVQEP